MRTPFMAGSLLALAALLAACSTTATNPTAAPATAAPSTAPATAAPSTAAPSTAAPSAAPSTAPSAAAAGAAVDVATTSLGDILVDGAGMTLYIFTADSKGASTCTGDCAASWPPLVSAGAPTLGTGLDATAFTTIARADGTQQVAFHDMPLYTFAGDKAAGDTNGQGLGGKWYVVKADGTVVK